MSEDASHGATPPAHRAALLSVAVVTSPASETNTTFDPSSASRPLVDLPLAIAVPALFTTSACLRRPAKEPPFHRQSHALAWTRRFPLLEVSPRAPDLWGTRRNRGQACDSAIFPEVRRRR